MLAIIIKQLNYVLRRVEPSIAPIPVSSTSNFDDAVFASEFCKRFLVGMSREESAEMRAQAQALGPKGLVATAVAMPLVILAGAAGGPFAALAASAGTSIKVMQALDEVGRSIEAAGVEVTKTLKQGDVTGLPSTKAWVEAHKGNLVGYLGKLDSYEDDYRRANSLTKRINLRGNPDAVRQADQEFLIAFLKHWHRPNDRLATPIIMPTKMSPEYFMTVMHQSQLSRTLWRDVARTAGPDKSAARQMVKVLTGKKVKPKIAQHHNGF